MHYFVVVARCGQISAAATEIGLSQSAMTLAIADLEHVMGTALLDRGRQGVTLTLQGQGFLQHAESVLRMANEAARFSMHERDLCGKLKVAATYTVLGYFLLPALAHFCELHPQVELSLEEMPRKNIEAGLANGQLELGALLLSNLETPERLETRVLGRSRRQLWVAADHEYAGRGSVSFEELAALPYVMPMVDEGDRNARRYWADAGHTPRKIIQTSSMEALREMVALNLGVTILSDMVFRPWSLDGRRIHAVPMVAHLPVMEVGLAWAAGRTLSPCAAALEQFLCRSFANGSHALAKI
ncbi:LysR family transcriptional regulator [Diaphorobacter sp.]|uniref:LysR family transcriptional regulator n=1 Tax=Diaphorobacter sp. TaxID=1934310 RepID=UPI0028A9148D|nr:LysR family transcriptional regulator [Diaphorobacter sp.]